MRASLAIRKNQIHHLLYQVFPDQCCPWVMTVAKWNVTFSCISIKIPHHLNLNDFRSKSGLQHFSIRILLDVSNYLIYYNKQSTEDDQIGGVFFFFSQAIHSEKFEHSTTSVKWSRFTVYFFFIGDQRRLLLQICRRPPKLGFEIIGFKEKWNVHRGSNRCSMLHAQP